MKNMSTSESTFPICVVKNINIDQRNCLAYFSPTIMCNMHEIFNYKVYMYECYISSGCTLASTHLPTQHLPHKLPKHHNTITQQKVCTSHVDERYKWPQQHFHHHDSDAIVFILSITDPTSPKHQFYLINSSRHLNGPPIANAKKGGTTAILVRVCDNDPSMCRISRFTRNFIDNCSGRWCFAVTFVLPDSKMMHIIPRSHTRQILVLLSLLVILFS